LGNILGDFFHNSSVGQHFGRFFSQTRPVTLPLIRLVDPISQPQIASFGQNQVAQIPHARSS
jgi:hypothetical protein